MGANSDWQTDGARLAAKSLTERRVNAMINTRWCHIWEPAYHLLKTRDMEDLVTRDMEDLVNLHTSNRFEPCYFVLSLNSLVIVIFLLRIYHEYRL